jgi:uncharacterized phage protein (TIGR01671 family)
MREIKFRAWDTVMKKYMRPWPEGFSLFGEVTCFDLLGQQFAEQKRNTLLSFNDLIIEQYTGLKDKNGREIYEGDIVIASWHWKSPHAIELPDDYYAFTEYAIDDEMTIIGNIHENPELLV